MIRSGASCLAQLCRYRSGHSQCCCCSPATMCKAYDVKCVCSMHPFTGGYRPVKEQQQLGRHLCSRCCSADPPLCLHRADAVNLPSAIHNMVHRRHMLGILGGREGHEAKATRLAGVPVSHHDRLLEVFARESAEKLIGGAACSPADSALVHRLQLRGVEFGLWASKGSHLDGSKLREVGPERLCMGLPGDAQYHQLAASKAFVTASLFPSICPIGHAVGRGCAVR